jgi:DMSO/TMAO reductase YedYZ heme-binding membrane subunit
MLWRSETSRWLLVNRRGIGLGFALAHSVHLAALVVIALAFPHPFVDELNVVTLLGGGLVYVFIFAMAATSNDRSVRHLGEKRWRLLHTAGSWYIWLIFAQSYLPRAFSELLYSPFAILLLGAPGVRIARRIRLWSASAHHEDSTSEGEMAP